NAVVRGGEVRAFPCWSMHSAVKVWGPAAGSVVVMVSRNVAPGAVVMPAVAHTVFPSIRYLTLEIEESASLADTVSLTLGHGASIRLSVHRDGLVVSCTQGGRSALATLPATSVTST